MTRVLKGIGNRNRLDFPLADLGQRLFPMKIDPGNPGSESRSGGNIV